MRELVVAGIAALTLISVTRGEECPRTFKPVVTWGGEYSANDEKGFVRCVSAKQLHELWRKHAPSKLIDDLKLERAKQRVPDVINDGHQSCPDVDFKSHMVVAIFNGKGYADAGITIGSIIEHEKQLIVRYRVLEYQTAVEPGVPERDRRTQSYAFAVIPVSSKEIVFEEDEANGISERNEPRWKSKGRIPPLNAVNRNNQGTKSNAPEKK